MMGKMINGFHRNGIFRFFSYLVLSIQLNGSNVLTRSQGKYLNCMAVLSLIFQLSQLYKNLTLPYLNNLQPDQAPPFQPRIKCLSSWRNTQLIKNIWRHNRTGIFLHITCKNSRFTLDMLRFIVSTVKYVLITTSEQFTSGRDKQVYYKLAQIT